LVAGAVVLLLTGLGWRWRTTLPVPLNSGVSFTQPVDVGTSVSFGYFTPSDTDITVDRARVELSVDSAAAAVALSVCTGDGYATIGSQFGRLPAGACQPLETFRGQALDEDDYLLVTVVPLAPGVVAGELVVHAKSGWRNGSTVIDLPSIEAET